MTGELKSLLDSEGVELTKFQPANPEVFSLWLVMKCGIKDKEGADLFQIQVCTPQWIQQELIFDRHIFGMNKLFVNSFDPKFITDAIQEYCAACVGNEWQEIALKIMKIAEWEFEGYKPYKPN